MTDRDQRSDPPEHEWERGWDGHSIAQMRRLARLPLIEKIRWLEEAERLAKTLTEARERKPEARD